MAQNCIVVTGASRGIGAAIAHALARQGHTVVCLSRSGAAPALSAAPNLSTVPDDIASRWRPLQADVTDPQSLHHALSKVTAEGWRIVGLVNNAGLHLDAPSATLPLAQWHQVMDTNAKTRTHRSLLKNGIRLKAMTSPPVSALSPLRFSEFRAMWLMWLISNAALWMWSVAAASQMVELRASPFQVALVQSATSLPMLFLGLASGALADRLDRRRLLLGSQAWVLGVTLVQVARSGYGAGSAEMLLAVALAFGCGVAMRNPSYHATVTGLVPSAHLPPALALNAVAMNLARIFGPVLAGMIIAFGSSTAVFVAIAGLSLVSILLIVQWKPAPRVPVAQQGSLLASMGEGLAHVRGSRPLRGNLLRIAVYCGSATGMPALLPLLAQDLRQATPTTFSQLLATMGVGSVLATAILQPLRTRFSRDRLEVAGALVHGSAMVCLSQTRDLLTAFLCMWVAGVAWIIAANSMTIATQRFLPDDFRARGMAIHQMVLMASISLGAATWGQVATHWNVRTALAAAGVTAGLGLALAVRGSPDR